MKRGSARTLFFFVRNDLRFRDEVIQGHHRSEQGHPDADHPLRRVEPFVHVLETLIHVVESLVGVLETLVDGREAFFGKLVGSSEALFGALVGRGKPFLGQLVRGSKPLFETRLSPGAWYDVSKEGRFLMPTQLEQAAIDPMTVVVNWTAGLKR